MVSFWSNIVKNTQTQMRKNPSPIKEDEPNGWHFHLQAMFSVLY